MANLWDLLDTDKIDPKLAPVAELISWSMSEDKYTTFNLFLDIIGYSDEEYGHEIFTHGGKIHDEYKIYRGYVEASYLAEALQCYATRPQEVFKYINQVMESDQ